MQELETLLAGGLEDEVMMLRASTRRMLAMAAEMGSWDETIAVLGALGAAASRLAGLLKVQKRLTGEDPHMMAAISKALSEVANELALKSEPSKRRVSRTSRRRSYDRVRSKPALD